MATTRLSFDDVRGATNPRPSPADVEWPTPRDLTTEPNHPRAALGETFLNDQNIANAAEGERHRTRREQEAADHAVAVALAAEINGPAGGYAPPDQRIAVGGYAVAQPVTAGRLAQNVIDRNEDDTEPPCLCKIACLEGWRNDVTSRREYCTFDGNNICLVCCTSLIFLVIGAIHLPFVLVPSLLFGVVLSPLALLLLALPLGLVMTASVLVSPQLGPNMKILGLLLVLPSSFLAAGLLGIGTVLGAVLFPLVGIAIAIGDNHHFTVPTVAFASAYSIDMLWVVPTALHQTHAMRRSLARPLAPGEVPFDFSVPVLLLKLLFGALGAPFFGLVLTVPAVLAAPVVALNVVVWNARFFCESGDTARWALACFPFTLVWFFASPVVVLALVPVVALVRGAVLGLESVWDRASATAVADYVVESLGDAFRAMREAMTFGCK